MLGRAVILFSGGLDSTTVVAMAKHEGYDVFPLTLSYGQRHTVEIDAAKRSAASLEVREPKVIVIDLAAIGGSALTDNIEVPKDRGGEEMTDIPITYVPARNTIMLSIALGYAEVLSADHIFVGVNAVDYSGYPDCRPEFIEAFEHLGNLATKRGVEGHRLKIHAPLIYLKKKDIIEAGLRLGVDYRQTHSCYDPDANGGPCAHCDACIIRQTAFAELGMEDPVLTRTTS